MAEEKNENFKYRMTEWRGFVSAKLEAITEKQASAHSKIDTLLAKCESFATTEEIEKRLDKQHKLCSSQFGHSNPSRDPPNDAGIQLLRASWKELGALGASFGVIFGLLIVILKLIGVL